MSEIRNMWVDGKWAPAAGGKTLASTNPVSGEELARIPAAGAEDIDRAVKAARTCFESKEWQSLSARDRGQILRDAAVLIMEHATELARLETRDNGKPIKESSLIDIPAAAQTFEDFGSMASNMAGRAMPVEEHNFAYSLYEPWGVAAQIIPWNYPLLMAAWKLAPALGAGNTVVLKPSELTSLTALELGRILEQTDLPAGAVNILTGTGEEAGAALVNHPGVARIAFTGSCEVGSSVLSASSRHIVPVSLELGGKSAALLFEDSDIETAVQGLLASIFMNQGQMCVACSRLLVEECIYEEVMASLTAKAAKLRLGDGLEPATDMGPLISFAHRDRVAGFVDRALEAGARLETGGPCQDPELSSGAFYQPTILSNVTPEMEIWKQEVFGPVLAVSSFRDEEEAVRLANDSEYGLAASLWTRDNYRIQRLTHAINAGMIWVNTFARFSNAVPFGGFKQSGIGKELGREGLRSWCRQKSISMDVSPDEKPLISRWYGV